MKAKLNRGNRAKTKPVDDFSGIDPSKIKLEGLEGPKISLYEYNQSLMANEKPLPAEELLQCIEKVIYEYTTKNLDTVSRHFMLLCKDINYYTIFEYDNTEKYWNIVNTFLECVKNVGEVLNIELNTENNTPEIWVRTPEGENLCMYFFNCEDLVVTFGG